MQVSEVMAYVKWIDSKVYSFRNAMKHSHPASVESLRLQIKELERLRDAILDSTVDSSVSVTKYLEKTRECIRYCMRDSYSLGDTSTIPRTAP